MVTALEDSPMRQLGRYRIIDMLGQGGMGTIQLAVVGGLGGFRKLVVLKVLRDDLALDPKFVDMFMREATLAACLNHPNVVHTVEAGEEDGRYFLVMEFLDGQPFSALLRGAGREPLVPLRLRVQVICDALAGLHYAHELADYDGRTLHLVHRDVSPSNIFVTYDGQVKLLDFGIAKARDAEETRPGEFKGKIGYAAPEQLRGQPADRRIDVFAAGVVLWEAIALRHLVQGRPTRQTFAARLSGMEPRIAQIVPSVAPGLAAICDRAMHPDPGVRYPTAEAFRHALQGFLADGVESFDAAAIGRVMRGKFADARTAMHRVIDARMREHSFSDSMVTALVSRSSRLSEPPSARRDSGLDLEHSGGYSEPALRPRWKRWLLGWLAFPVLAALVLAVLLWRAHRSSIERAAQRSQAASMTQNPASPAPSPPRAAQRPSGAAAQPELEEATAQHAPAPPAHAESTGSEDSTGPNEAERSERSPAPSDPSGPRRGRREQQESPATRPSGAAKPPATLESDAAARELDLRSIPRRERRRIDLENPFR